MGGGEVPLAGGAEPTLKYHSSLAFVLTGGCDIFLGQCLVGSLTGAVASQRVTEASKGSLRLVGNQPLSAKA